MDLCNGAGVSNDPGTLATAGIVTPEVRRVGTTLPSQ